MKLNTKSQAFSAAIYKVGINPCIEVPGRVSAFFERRGNVPVAGTLNGVPIRATLVPVGTGRHRLYINGEMRKQANVDVGDRIHVILRLDTKPRVVPMPIELREALRQNREAKTAFEKLRPSHQKEILTYLNWLRKPDSLKRNIDKVIAFLLKQKRTSRS